MPSDPQDRLRVERQLDLLADAKAELIADHLEEGLSAAKEVLVRARDIGWAPLEAEALLVIGDRIGDLERDPAHEQDALHEAARAAIRGEHWFLAVEAWARLARGLALHKQPDEAKRWLDHATALAGDLGSTSGESPRLQAELSNARFQWHYGSERYAEAEVDARLRRDQVAQWYGNDSLQVADALNWIGRAVYMQYRKDEAVELYSEAVAIIERVSGPEHPSVATMHSNIGVVSTDKGHWAEAHVHYQRALAIRRSVYPPGHELLLVSQINLANLYVECDSPHAGLAVAREIVGVLAQVHGEAEDKARRAGKSETELAALRVEIVPYLLLLGRTLERSGAHGPALTVLVHAMDLLDRAPDSRLPPGTKLDTEHPPRTPHFEGCRLDIAVELQRSAEALHSTAIAEQAAAIVAASPSFPSFKQRCYYELEDWKLYRSQ